MLTHINKDGRGQMVDIGEKEETKRLAIAEGKILMNEEALKAMKEGKIKKGEVLSIAQIAGIMGAKKTSDLIPLCHPISLNHVDIEFEWLKNGVKVRAICSLFGKTGVEMEALSACTTALLTIYDMGKAIDKEMIIKDIYLMKKIGGKSGILEYKRPRVKGLNISETKGVIKNPIDSAEFKVDFGMVDDAHGGDWHRQVSLLDMSSYEKMKDNDELLPQGSFAENITTEGIILYDLPVGTVLQIGETVQEVTQIGKKCHHGCEIKALVGDCVMPREGIFTKVLVPGKVYIGDEISIIKMGKNEDI